MRAKSRNVCLAAALVVACSTGGARAQFVPFTPYGAFPFHNVPVTPFPYGFDPSGGGYLMGAADVIRAQGQYLQDRQQAFTQRERARQEQLRTRRMLFDQRRYELANTPSREEIRERNRQQFVLRAMTNPPGDEITNAQALNSLLDEFALRHARGDRGPEVPVDPETLRRVNVTGASGRSSNPALLKTGRIDWPSALREPRFDALRDGFEAAFTEAVGQIRQGNPDPALVARLGVQLDQLRAALTGSVAELSLGDSMHALEFVDNLREAVDALNDANLVGLVSRGEASPQGRTVGEVVDSMSSRGLRFAPALSGQEADYFALRDALARYGLSMTASLSTSPRE